MDEYEEEADEEIESYSKYKSGGKPGQLSLSIRRAF